MTHLIDSKQLSKELGIPEGTIAQWRYLGKGPDYIRVGRYVRYRPEAVEAWLAAQTQSLSA